MEDCLNSMFSAGVISQADLFGRSFLLGICFGFLYDLLRIGRRVFHRGKIWIGVEDLLYWLIYAMVVFLSLYKENAGLVRGFAIGAMAAGMLAYLLICSRIVIKVGVTVLRVVCYGLCRIIMVMTAPVRWLIKKIRVPLKAGIHKIKKLRRMRKKRLKNAWKEVKMSLRKM